MLVKPQQMRAARALLGWSQADLAERAGVAELTVINFEGAKNTPTTATLEKLMHAVNAGGVELLANGGVMPRQNTVITYSGFDGFAEFRKDVLASARQGNPDICVSNVDEQQFNYWGNGKVNDEYRTAMASLENISVRILVKKGDTNLIATKFATYKYVDDNEFGEIPLYLFGNKTSFLNFEENSFEAFIIEHEKITAFFRTQFEKTWSHAKKVGE